MFKENWPLTGLVKLLNPAGGRQLRLICEQEDCKAVSSASGCWPGDHHASQDTNDVQQFGAAGQWFRAPGNRMWTDTERIMDVEGWTPEKVIGWSLIWQENMRPSEPHFLTPSPRKQLEEVLPLVAVPAPWWKALLPHWRALPPAPSLGGFGLLWGIQCLYQEKGRICDEKGPLGLVSSKHSSLNTSNKASIRSECHHVWDKEE